MAKTGAAGEINCVDPGSFGVVTITRALTIDCGEIVGSVLNAGANGILINAPGDVVRIRNLSIEGTGAGLNGVSILAALSVHIDNLVIDGQRQAGIRDVRTGSGQLFVTTTVVRNNGGIGIAVAPAGGVIAAVLEKVLTVSNHVGAAVGQGGKLRVNRSVLAANANAGVSVDAGGAAMLDSCVISANAIGVRVATGSESTIDSSVITENGVAIQKDDNPSDTPLHPGVRGRSL